MATEEDRINTGVLLTIGLVLALAVVGVALAVTALVRSESEQLEAEKGATANLRPLQELQKEQETALQAAPTWWDKEAQLVSVPIDRAKQLMLEDLKKDPRKATAPAPPPPDAGATEDAGAAAEDAGAAPAAEDAGADGATTAREQGGDEGGVTPKKAAPKKPPAPPAPQPPAPQPPAP